MFEASLDYGETPSNLQEDPQPFCLQLVQSPWGRNCSAQGLGEGTVSNLQLVTGTGVGVGFFDLMVTFPLPSQSWTHLLPLPATQSLPTTQSWFS